MFALPTENHCSTSSGQKRPLQGEGRHYRGNARMTTRVYPIAITPLESLVGIKDAHLVYNELEMIEQIVLDLLLAGWSQTQIADTLMVSQPWVSVNMRRIRYKIANSRMRNLVEIRSER